MATKKLQVQWLREDAALADQFAEWDRKNGLDDSYQRGKADGLRAALKIMGVGS